MKPYQQFLQMWSLPARTSLAEQGVRDAVEESLMPDHWPGEPGDIPLSRASVPAQPASMC